MPVNHLRRIAGFLNGFGKLSLSRSTRNLYQPIMKINLNLGLVIDCDERLFNTASAIAACHIGYMKNCHHMILLSL